jgi:Mg/Co/Ni transporter MgtE
MKKVVRLTESDLSRIVKRIIKEEEMGHTQEEMNDVWHSLNEMDDDEIFNLMDMTFEQNRMSVEQFVNYLPTHLGYSDKYLISVLKQIKEEGI